MLKRFLARIAGKAIAKQLDLKEGPVETKKWYRSTTMWSDVVTIAVAIVGMVDVHFTNGQIATNPIYQLVLTVLGGIGIYGRKAATAKIG